MCDLPETPTDVMRPYGGTKYHWALCYTGINVCPCWMCHAGPQHRRATRTQRHGCRVSLAMALTRWRGRDTCAFDDTAFDD